MESVIGLFKTEAIATTSSTTAPTKPWPTSDTPPPAGVDWYNHRRRHGSLDWLTPVEYEHDRYGALSREPQPR